MCQLPLVPERPLLLQFWGTGVALWLPRWRKRIQVTMGRGRFPSGLTPTTLVSQAHGSPTHPCPRVLPGYDWTAFLHPRGPPGVAVRMKKQKQTNLPSSRLLHCFLISSFIWAYEHPAERKLASRNQHLVCGYSPACKAQGQVGGMLQDGLEPAGVQAGWGQPHSPFSSWICSPKC